MCIVIIDNSSRRAEVECNFRIMSFIHILWIGLMYIELVIFYLEMLFKSPANELSI